MKHHRNRRVRPAFFEHAEIFLPRPQRCTQHRHLIAAALGGHGFHGGGEGCNLVREFGGRVAFAGRHGILASTSGATPWGYTGQSGRAERPYFTGLSRSRFIMAEREGFEHPLTRHTFANRNPHLAFQGFGSLMVTGKAGSGNGEAEIA